MLLFKANAAPQVSLLLHPSKKRTTHPVSLSHTHTHRIEDSLMSCIPFGAYAQALNMQNHHSITVKMNTLYLINKIVATDYKQY